jgi:hypothetical protein
LVADPKLQRISRKKAQKAQKKKRLCFFAPFRGHKINKPATI